MAEKQLKAIKWDLRWGFMSILAIICIIGWDLVNNEIVKNWLLLWTICFVAGALIAAVLPALMHEK